jgi:hypothetical protein
MSRRLCQATRAPSRCLQWDGALAKLVSACAGCSHRRRHCLRWATRGERTFPRNDGTDAKRSELGCEGDDGIDHDQGRGRFAGGKASSAWRGDVQVEASTAGQGHAGAPAGHETAVKRSVWPHRWIDPDACDADRDGTQHLICPNQGAEEEGRFDEPGSNAKLRRQLRDRGLRLAPAVSELLSR